MFWIADVFIGTNSQGWGNHKTGAVVVEKPHRAKHRSRLRKLAGQSWTWLIGGLREMRERRELRQNLSRLNDHMLRDIGVTRAQIEACVRDPELRFKSETTPRPWRRLFLYKADKTVPFPPVPAAVPAKPETTEGGDVPSRGASERRAA